MNEYWAHGRQTNRNESGTTVQTNQPTNQHTHIHKSEACVYIDWNSPKPKSSRQAAMWVYEIHSALRCVCIMCIVGRSLIHSPIHSLCLSLPWISYMLIIYISLVMIKEARYVDALIRFLATMQLNITHAEREKKKLKRIKNHDETGNWANKTIPVITTSCTNCTTHTYSIYMSIDTCAGNAFNMDVFLTTK